MVGVNKYFLENIKLTVPNGYKTILVVLVTLGHGWRGGVRETALVSRGREEGFESSDWYKETVAFNMNHLQFYSLQVMESFRLAN